jgi:tetratricopeptide (TPR) repeat protein
LKNKKKKTPSQPTRTVTVNQRSGQWMSPARWMAALDPPRLWPRLWPYVLLTAVALGIYANALTDGFVWDDYSQLLGNPLVTNWRAIPFIFRHDIWAFAHEGLITSNYYRPIQIVLYMAMYYAAGFNAFFFHLGMLLIHVGNTLLVYFLARRWLGGQTPALVAGILFAVHPIHNESVVWIAALPDVLMTLLVLLSLALFVRCNAAPRPALIAVLTGLFLLALLSKEPGAMLLPLLAGYEFLYLGRPLWPRRFRRIPAADSAAVAQASDLEGGPRTLWDNWVLYLSLTGAFGVYAFLRIQALGGMAPAQGRYYTLHGTVLILSIIDLLGQYFVSALAPIRLNHFHVFNARTSFTPLLGLALAVEFGMIAAIFFLRKSPATNDETGREMASPNREVKFAPLVSYGIFFFLLPLAPALNINGVGENVFAERYLYLPTVGFVMIVAAAWQWLADKQREVAWAALGIVTATSAWILLPRNLDWHDDLRFAKLVVAVAPQSASAMGNLGWLYFQQGEYDVAIEKLKIALKLPADKSVIATLHDDIGQAYARKGLYREAETELRKALELNPDAAAYYWHLGLTLEWMGDIPGAVAQYDKALELRPRYAEVYTSLAMLRMKDQDYPAAIELFQRAVAANQRYLEAYVNMGVAYNNTSRYAEGAAAFLNAIAVAPDDPNAYMAHYNLGLSYVHLNSLDAAVKELSFTLQLKPDFEPARAVLAQLRPHLPALR